MKRICIRLAACIALTLPIFASANIGNNFTSVYLKWKTEFHMSAFTPEEDRLLNERVLNGDCGLITFSFAIIGGGHLPTEMRTVQYESNKTPHAQKYQWYLEEFKRICKINGKPAE